MCIICPIYCACRTQKEEALKFRVTKTSEVSLLEKVLFYNSTTNDGKSVHF